MVSLQYTLSPHLCTCGLHYLSCTKCISMHGTTFERHSDLRPFHSTLSKSYHAHYEVNVYQQVEHCICLPACMHACTHGLIMKLCLHARMCWPASCTYMRAQMCRLIRHGWHSTDNQLPFQACIAMHIMILILEYRTEIMVVWNMWKLH